MITRETMMTRKTTTTTTKKEVAATPDHSKPKKKADFIFWKKIVAEKEASCTDAIK